MGCNVHVTTRGWIQLIGNYPILWDIGAVIVQYSSSNYFWYLSTGWALTFGSFSACSMGCITCVTRGWIQLTVLVELSLLWHIGAVDVCRLFQLNYFWYLSTRMGLTLCSFQHAQWVGVHVTTRGWIQLSSGTIHFFDIGAVIVRTGSSSSTILVSFN
jgi:hypothetical protein